MLIVSGCSQREDWGERLEAAQINRAIENGLIFLAENQLARGGFPTWITEDSHFEGDGFFANSVYITSFILYSISFTNTSVSQEIIDKGLHFIQEEMIPPGVWSFYSCKKETVFKNGEVYETIPLNITPDLDCTAVSLFCLVQNNILCETDIKREIFTSNKSEEGLFLTWLHDIIGSDEMCEDVIQLNIDWNDVCWGTNSNILLLLGDGVETSAVSCFLLDVVKNRDMAQSMYFYSEYSLYYLFSRAYFNGAHSLKDGREIIIDRLESLQQVDGSYGNPLHTALAACTFMNFSYFDEPLLAAVENIIYSQDEKGSWPGSPFFVSPDNYYYGSSELTTALSLEALSRFINESLKSL